MGHQVFFHVLFGIRRRKDRVRCRDHRADGHIHGVRRHQRHHSVGRAPVPGDANRHQLFPTQPHRGRPAVRRHHASPRLRAHHVQLAVRRLRLPAVSLLAGMADK